MKKFWLIVTVALFFGCQSRSYYTKEMRTVALWTNHYMESIRKADIERLLSLYTDDVVFLPPNQPQFSGKENLRKWFLNYFNYYQPAEQFHISSLNTKGDNAYLVCTYQVSLKVNQSGEQLVDQGKSIFLFKRQKGNWKCTYAIWNTNKPTFDFHFLIPEDFTGTWELDKNKSQDIPNLVSSKIVIIQNGNDISVNRTYNMKDKPTYISSTNFTIGTELKSETETGSLLTTGFWSEDRRSFTVVEKLLYEQNGVQKESERTTTYSKTAKGEILNVISDELLPDGTFSLMNQGHIEMIFHKI